MEWLRAPFLWGLAALGLPVLIHLLGRKRQRTMKVATLRFLMAAKVKASARIKLKNLLLLLARMAALAALVLLFAGPVARGERAETARNTVLVVDTSPSMAAARGGVTRLQEAKKELSVLLDNASDQDQFAVIPTETGFMAEAQPFVGRLEAKSRLAKLGIGNHDSKVPRALLLAKALLGTRVDGMVVLASDMRRHAFADAASLEKLGFSLSVLDVGLEDSANAFITGVQEVGEAVKVSAERNGPGGERFSIGLNLGKGKKLTAFLTDGAAAEFRPGPAPETLVAKAVVEPGGDLAYDDEVEVALAAKGPARVLLVNGDPKAARSQDELYFVRLALAAGGRLERNFDVREIRQPDLSVERAAGFDVVVLANPAQLDRETAAGLLKLVREGLGLMISAGDGFNFEKADDALSQLLAAPLRDRMVLTGADSSRPPFEEIDNSAFKPPFSGGGNLPPLLEGTRVSGYWIADAQKSEGVSVLARLGNQIPLLMERKVGRGRLLLLSTSLDRDWSDLCLKPGFLPFLESLFTFAAGRSAGVLNPLTVLGESVSSPFPETVSLKAPDAVLSEWLPGESYQPKTTGFYSVFRGERLLGGFFVRPDPAESDLSPLGESEFKAIGEKLGVKLEGALKEGYSRKDYSWLMALILMISLAAEALLSAKVRKFFDPAKEWKEGEGP